VERTRGGARRLRVCLSMCSITENIYYSQLSSVAILLQPGRNCFTSRNTRIRLGSLSLCAIALRSFRPSHVSACNCQRSSLLFCVHCVYDGIDTSVWRLKQRCLFPEWHIDRVCTQKVVYRCCLLSLEVTLLFSACCHFH
jgi:hypothetical protein